MKTLKSGKLRGSASGLPFVSALLLAAGQSIRMGRPKLLLPLGESTIIEQTIDNLLNSRVDEVIVVVGFRAQEHRERIGKRPVEIVTNLRYSEGMSASLVAGLNAVGKRAQAVMVALADQPFVESSLINELLDAFAKHNKGIVVPVYQGRRGHPVVLSMRYREKLLALKGDIGARQIIEENRDDLLEVPVESDSVSIDLDTPDDYARAVSGSTSIRFSYTQKMSLGEM
jgi:molybdenum cofactor cytidylyltransferase